MSSIAPTVARWHGWPRIFAEQLAPPREPLALLLRPGDAASPAIVARSAARALLGDCDTSFPLPSWLAPHQASAARRLNAILECHGGALLADAVGLGKSYVALGVALSRREPFALVVPAVLVDQWSTLLARHDLEAPIVTHEALSTNTVRLPPYPGIRLFVVDEAHRFRNHGTQRYRRLAKLVVGARVLLVTATPIHNRLEDLFRLFHLFLRDDALIALGVPSLHRAAQGTVDPALVRAAVARLTVARSRSRVRSGTKGELLSSFPKRAPGRLVRAGALADPELETVIAEIRGLATGTGAAALFRLLLLTRLASSVAAFRDSLRRYDVYLEMASQAAAEGRALGSREFQRIFPDRESDALQLTLFPSSFTPGVVIAPPDDRAAVQKLRSLLGSNTSDPKAAALENLLAAHHGKTIVFTGARATARYLARRLANRRVAVVLGDRGMLGGTRASRREVLRAFAPRSQEAPAPRAALETDVLIATDLLSEGVNLQDAVRVIHYDLPWSPARLAQRVGRIERLGSPHHRIETVTFLPARPLADALRLEERLAAKALVQSSTSARVETVRGPTDSGAFDWCDRLDTLARGSGQTVPGACAVVSGREEAVVLVIRIGALVEAIIVDSAGVHANPARATALLEHACRAAGRPPDRSVLESAIERAGPLLRGRLGAVADARWRAGDRDRLSRRLIPWALTAARAAAHRGDSATLVRLDALVSRLACGMTAGEEALLEELLEGPAPISGRNLLAWHERLPPPRVTDEAPRAELVAALIVTGPGPH